MNRISLLFTIFFLGSGVAASAAFTEFYVQATGSNLNAGSTNADAASITSTNGDWNSASANTFTAASGTPFSGVTAGTSFASVYLDGATTAVYVAQITSVNGGGASITLSATVKAGTAPAAGATGRSCKVGGAWAGPAGAVALPFNFASEALALSSTTPVRINWKTGTYTVSAGMTHALAGVHFEAYNTTPGDNGAFATLSGPTTGTAFTLLAGTSMQRCSFEGFIFENNGNSGGTGVYLLSLGEYNLVRRCKFRNSWGNGLYNNLKCIYYEVEATNNCLGGGLSTQAGIKINISGSAGIRMVSSESAKAGITADGGILVFRAISYRNAGAGMGSTGNENQFCVSSDMHENGFSGAHLGLGSETMMNTNYFNSNFTKNVGYGFEAEGQPTPGMFFHNSFGSGSEANTVGTWDYDKYRMHLSVTTYPTNQSPFSDAANGVFNITGAGADETGYAVWTQLHPSFFGTTGVIDRGAAQR